MSLKRPSRYDAIIDVANEVLAAQEISFYQNRHYHSVVALLKDIRSLKDDYYSLGREINEYCRKKNTTREELRQKYLLMPQHKLTYIGYLVYIHKTEEVIIKMMSSTLYRMKKRYGDKGQRSYQLIKSHYFDALPNTVFVRSGRGIGEEATITYKDAYYSIRTYQRWHKEAIEKFGSVFFGFGSPECEMDVHITTEVVKGYLARIRQYQLERERNMV